MSGRTSGPRRLLPCGDAAFLVEVEDLDTVLRLVAALDAARETGALDDVIDVVPAARTVLLRCRPGGDRVRSVAALVRSLDLPDEPPEPGEEVTIPVVYDGEDLDEVASLTGMSRDEVVARHQEVQWRVAFTGFAPGFGYLVGDDTSLHVPRREDPRTKVPAGAVGLAGEFTGVYPRSSPGGWQLIGRTDTKVWDPGRASPALLAPGNLVRFEQASS